MKSTGATTLVTGNSDRIRAWVAHHKSVLSVTILHLLEHKLSSLMNWLVIGIALTIPILLYVMLNNFSALSGNLGGDPRVSLYLDSGVKQRVGERIAEEISNNALVEAAHFISSEAALKDFQQRSGIPDVMDSLERKTLPHSIEVILNTIDPIAQKELVAAWESSDSIARVSFDLAWVERLVAFLKIGERLVGALSIVLGLGVIVIMGNTIRLTIENRREEIEVIKLVGGTDSFVRRPFLYLGISYGLVNIPGSWNIPKSWKFLRSRNVQISWSIPGS